MALKTTITYSGRTSQNAMTWRKLSGRSVGARTRGEVARNSQRPVTATSQRKCLNEVVMA